MRADAAVRRSAGASVDIVPAGVVASTRRQRAVVAATSSTTLDPSNERDGHSTNRSTVEPMSPKALASGKRSSPSYVASAPLGNTATSFATTTSPSARAWSSITTSTRP